MSLPPLESIPKFLTFVCCGQSGHTILAAILDSHPNVIIGEEKKAIWRRRSKEDLYRVLFEDSQGRAKSTKSYRSKVGSFPNLYQGRYISHLDVIGDKCGWDVIGPQLDKENPTDRRIKQFLSRIHPAEHKYIHALRNPFDIISNWNSNKAGRKHSGHKGPDNILKAIDLYEKYARTIQKVYYDNGYNPYQIRNEDLCLDPEFIIESLCDYLEIPCPEDWLKICVEAINPVHRRVSEGFWTKESINKVEEIIDTYDFLGGYKYE